MWHVTAITLAANESNINKEDVMSFKPNASYDFSDAVVVITGAAAGIGRQVAEQFAAAGATLALIDRSESIVDIASNLGEVHRGWIADISDPESVAATANKILSQFNRVDILVNNAVNLRGAFLVARAFAPDMLARGQGRIVNLASQAAVIGIEGHVAYCASKAGVIGMTNCMALEWGPRGVTVNAISPTVVETELGLTGWAGEKGERARAAIPTRRFARPAEIACAIMYVASREAAMVNGANLLIDGGYTII
jgi:NAD(P)-dependent dehydrogenase (short-subunit alcohol dehydrogenase family)